MIKSLFIENFKSIKKLQFDCSRINLFVGESNTGKSNILESLALISCIAYCDKLQNFIRIKKIWDLFYNRKIEKNIRIGINEYILEVKYDYKKRLFLFSIMKKGEIYSQYYDSSGSPAIGEVVPLFIELQHIMFYNFDKNTLYDDISPTPLLPPNGKNLHTIIRVNKKIYKWIEDLAKDYGFQLYFVLGEPEMRFVYKTTEGPSVIPYYLLSDTLQRLIFYYVAIKSNENATIIFQEPEVHSFPPYINFLAETIAYDNNQYFISTHNNNFLLTLLYKAKKTDLNVFLTYMENNETKVKLLNENEIEKIMSSGSNFFYYIDDLIFK